MKNPRPNFFCYGLPKTEDYHEVKLTLSESDLEEVMEMPAVENSPWMPVTDLRSGMIYHVRPTSCPIEGCFCAAQATLIVP